MVPKLGTACSMRFALAFKALPIQVRFVLCMQAMRGTQMMNMMGMGRGMMVTGEAWW